MEWLEVAIAASVAAGATFALAKAVARPKVQYGPVRPSDIPKGLARLRNKSDMVRISLPNGGIGTIMVHDEGYATDFDPWLLDDIDYLPLTGRRDSKWKPD